MAEDWLARERLLLGKEAVDRLQGSRVLLFGVGGVGGYALEALVRAGIGCVTVVDGDTVSDSNRNRQLIADTGTVGLPKAETAVCRARKINPDGEFTALCRFADAENMEEIFDTARPDYVIDAIDTVTSKLAIIRTASSRKIPVISSMGTGAKLDPTRFRVTDISKTHTCPLAKIMRLKLREAGIFHCEVLFSDEPPIRGASETDPETGRHVPGSVSFVPSAAGLILAGHVIKRLSGMEK